MGDPSSTTTSTGPLLQLLANGLKIWVRRQCDAVGELKLELHGSALELLRGRLSGVSLMAKEVIFQGLPLHYAELKSGPLRLNMNLGKSAQVVTLEQSFDLQGTVSITDKDLNQVLLSDPWRWLGDWLAEELIGITPLGGLQINNDTLELQAPVIGQQEPARRRFLIKADKGTVLIRHQDVDLEASLPMDPAIHIEEAVLNGGQLHLKGRASVTP